MKRVVYSALCLGLTVILAACGQRTVDEELLPTRVATLAADVFAAPTATATSLPPTATPEPVAASAEVPATGEITATEEITAGEALTESEAFSPTTEITAGEALTETGEVTETAVLTETEESGGAASLIPPDEITATEEITATGEVTTTEDDTEAELPEATTTPALSAGEAVTESSEITETGGITATETTTETDEAGAEATAEEEATPEEATPEAAATETMATEAAAQADPNLEGLPEEVLAAMANADPVRGQQLTLTNACIGCHNTDPSMPMVGPTWHNVGTTAATRIPGMSAGLYLYNSIIHPNDYVVENYPPGVMLQIYGSLPPQDLADLVAYLLTLKEQP